MDDASLTELKRCKRLLHKYNSIDETGEDDEEDLEYSAGKESK